jgi:hypothetical protein
LGCPSGLGLPIGDRASYKIAILIGILMTHHVNNVYEPSSTENIGFHRNKKFQKKLSKPKKTNQKTKIKEKTKRKQHANKKNKKKN